MPPPLPFPTCSASGEGGAMFDLLPIFIRLPRLLRKLGRRLFERAGFDSSSFPAYFAGGEGANLYKHLYGMRFREIRGRLLTYPYQRFWA